ncbi:ABC transporter substrate-binding protein [Opitutus sp. ER46]|uniref:ABC transporter substrate-binding protein n=1 Tax=Opitutus sp. ER46 TaxID=2161864 RepID=UPI000D314131|nr:ABC transporter substrate-binding protein [Opitutus sp. ER46]PTX91784.1 ethanolamine utilization protein EutJ [Opitutus sp. ER46]
MTLQHFRFGSDLRRTLGSFTCILRLSLLLLPVALAAAPIRIGEVEPLTGKEAAFGQSSHQGIVLAVEEINARGGVLGRRLELVTHDNQSRPGDTATITKKLITRDRVVAVVNGGTSNQCTESAPICQHARIPLVATTATNPPLTEMGNYVFRTCFTDTFQGAVLARFAHDTLKARRVALLTSVSSAFSVGLSRAFRDAFIALGGEIVGEQRYAEGDKDFRAQLTAIRGLKPDAIAAMGYYTEGALICRQARDLGLSCPLVSGDGWEAPELVQIGGAAVNGTFYSSHFSAESTEPAAQAFVQKYRHRFDGATPDSLAALSYDAMLILADALHRAGTTDGPAVRDALAATKAFPGITGRTTIDPRRDASKPATIIAVESGRFRLLQSIEP